MGILSTANNMISSLLKRRVVLVESEPARRNTFEDQLNSYSSLFSEVYPAFQFEFIEILSWLAIFNHDVSQVVKKITALGNTGHNLELEGKEKPVENALAELNDLARSAFPNNAGADGFINQQFRQVLIKGALCQETVPSPGLNEVSEVYQVKTSSIRFKFEENRYVPYQLIGIRQIRLNEETFSYIPLVTEEDNPYAIPPFVSALRNIMRNEKQWENIDEFVEKWGILGLVHMVFDLKREWNETEVEFRKRAESDLKRYYNMFKENMKSGIAVTGKNVDLKHNNISRNVGQMDKILEATHQGITSGLNFDPSMMGYSYSTTETYAGVVYNTMINEIENIRRIIKRANEHTYNLHLKLTGIPAVCSMKFNESPSLNQKEEIEAKKIDQEMIFERMDKGIIDEDTAARELGYEEAYRKNNRPGGNDKSGLTRLTAKFNSDRSRYEFVRPQIRIGFAEKKNDLKRIIDLEEGYASGFFEIYKVKYGKFLSGLEVHFTSDDIAGAIMLEMEQKMSGELPDDAKSVIGKWTGKSYRLGTGTEWDDEKWKVTDRNALDFLKRHDQHFFGKQFHHYADDMRAIVEDELKGIRGDKSRAVKSLKKKIGDAFESPRVKDYYDLVIRNSVNKSRNYGRVFQYERLGIAEVEIVAILDKKTSTVCREMNGRIIPVKFLADHVREVLETPMDELTEKFSWPRHDEIKSFQGASTDEILGKIKVPLPPYHGRCRTTTSVSKDIKINKSSEGSFTGKLSFNKKNGMALKRAAQLKNLKKNELLSKMDATVKPSWWNDEAREWPDGTTGDSYEYHKGKHDTEFLNIGGFDGALKKILKKYDRVYTFGDEDIKWIFYDPGNSCFLQISDNGEILRFHRYRNFRPKSYMVEIQ